MHTPLARTRRALATLALSASLLAPLAARPAGAWEYPLLPHVQGLVFFPETPNSNSHTIAMLSAVYLNECWAVVDSASERSSLVLKLGVTIAPSTGCQDTASTWTRRFDLGILPAGTHHLTVHCTVLYADQPPGEEEITVPFEVADAPPPPPPASGAPLLEVIEGTEALPGDPVSLTLKGFTPFACTLIHDEHTQGQGAVYATFDKVETCTDTTRRWQRSFDLGRFDEGDYNVAIHLLVNDPDGHYEYTTTAVVRVHPVGPPPPPPQYTLPLLEIIGGTVAFPGDPVTLTLSGFTPFECTLVHDENVQGQSAVSATFDPVASCTDTTRRWSRSFDLGRFDEGDHNVAIHLFVNVPDSNYEYQTTAVVRVHPPGPPPPPPIDSSAAGLSSGHPNPFRDQSSFAVSLDQAQFVDVAVFDLLGRRVVTIHHGVLPQGTSRLAWNGRRQDGSRAPGGVYFYQLTLPDRVVHRQVVLLGTP